MELYYTRLIVHATHYTHKHTELWRILRLLSPLPVPGLHELPLLLLLAILKVPAVAELHEVPGLVDLALEATEGGLDRLALGDGDFDVGEGG